MIRLSKGIPSTRRLQLVLLVGLLLALLITFFFGERAFRRFIDRPTDEPIRAWMNIPYVAHSYRVPPHVLFQALDLPVEHPPNQRPISRLARELNLSSEEVITRIEAAIAQERAAKAPPGQPPPEPPPAAATPLKPPGP
ncbi:MAG: hypothetical protein KF832_29905 [Caldilineaceae bacterium]|nr:hypothetical protein [Caldilineaceae bacterium]